MPLGPTFLNFCETSLGVTVTTPFYIVVDARLKKNVFSVINYYFGSDNSDCFCDGSKVATQWSTPPKALVRSLV